MDNKYICNNSKLEKSKRLAKELQISEITASRYLDKFNWDYKITLDYLRGIDELDQAY